MKSFRVCAKGKTPHTGTCSIVMSFCFPANDWNAGEQNLKKANGDDTVVCR